MEDDVYSRLRAIFNLVSVGPKLTAVKISMNQPITVITITCSIDIVQVNLLMVSTTRLMLFHSGPKAGTGRFNLQVVHQEKLTSTISTSYP
jgi:hypothetical protein